MKTILLLLAATCGTALAQGSLTPPAGPAPVMKSLQEIWDKLAVLDSQNQTRQQEINALGQTNQDQSAVLGVLLDHNDVALPWQISTVDSPGLVGIQPSLAFTPDGKPAISYLDSTNADLKYAVFNGSAWQTSTVDAAGLAGSGSSLAFTPDGMPAISYVTFSPTSVKYAVHNGSSWEITTVVSGTPLVYDVGRRTSLAFSPAGQPFICYESYTFGANGGALNLATLNLGIWNLAKIFPTPPAGQGDWGFSPSLAFSPSGQPALCFTENPDNPSSSTLGYLSFNGSTWQNVTVDSAPGGVGVDSSLAFSPAGHPVISYYDGAKTALGYAAFDGLTWHLATADNSANVGQYTSLAFSPAGQPTISYHDATNGDLKYAAFDGSTWQAVTVDSAGTVGQYTSLATTPGGQPAIAYFDVTQGDLKYAVRAPFTSP